MSLLVGIRRLGRIRYSKALVLQETLVDTYRDTVQSDGYIGEILLCEHPPVYTFGLREKPDEIEVKRLTDLGAEVFKVRRGGLTTFHGNGQLVCYPILNLRAFRLGVKNYFHSLEDSVIATLAHFEVNGYTTDQHGVWVRDNTGSESKICAFGIQVRYGVSFHGFGLNCNTELSWFQNINPCGDLNKAVTSLSQVCQRNIEPHDVELVLLENLAKKIGFSLELKKYNVM